MSSIDDVIGAWIKRVESTGELKHGRLWGRPFDLDDGYDQTPEEWRMPHKILKNAGYLPWEVEAMNRIAELQQALAGEGADVDAHELRRQLVELQQKLAVRLERRRR
jgi:hypothetical protein